MSFATQFPSLPQESQPGSVAIVCRLPLLSAAPIRKPLTRRFLAAGNLRTDSSPAPSDTGPTFQTQDSSSEVSHSSSSSWLGSSGILSSAITPSNCTLPHRLARCRSSFLGLWYTSHGTPRPPTIGSTIAAAIDGLSLIHI